MARQHGNAAVSHKFKIADKEGVTFDGKGVTVHNPTSFSLVENWNRLPVLAANVAFNKNLDFEVGGTNATAANVTARVGGGILLTTNAVSTEQVMIAAHTTAGESQWNIASWLSQKEPYWEALIETGAAITAQKIWAGLKLTNTPTIVTDANQAYFLFDTASTLGAASLHFITSRTDVDVDDILPITVAASTQYRLRIEIDSSRCPHVWVNGVEYTNSLSASGKAALTTAISLKPYFGIVPSAAAAKTLGVLPGYTIGRKCA